MELHLDFKIIAAKNPAKELIELNKKFCNCCEITEGNNGETLFDGFDQEVTLFSVAGMRFCPGKSSDRSSL